VKDRNATLFLRSQSVRASGEVVKSGLSPSIALLCSGLMLAQSALPVMAQSVGQTAASSTTGNTQGVTVPTTAQPSSNAIPFDQMLHASKNPIDAYRGKTVPPPSMANSVRLSSLMRDGKLYLTLRDAIDLALEDNLDMVIARYNLPIAQMDILRTAAGGQVRGVNTGVVSGTPGGAGTGGGSSTGSGAGGTTGGSGGAGAGAGGLVSSTLGTGTNVSNYDPFITANIYNDHASEQLTNFQVEGVSIYKFNTNAANVEYTQAFATGSSLQISFDNQRLTSNGIYDYFSPSFSTSLQVVAQQQLLAGFGLGPNLRFLHIARTNQKISDIGFKAQVIATVTQICDIYWDLVSAYDTEQASERSVAFATETFETSKKQYELQAIPQMDVLKAEGEVATREQDLTVARTNLQLQELYMKNAITRSLDDPTLEEMPVVPVDHIGGNVEAVAQPIQEMITAALKNRTELQESTLDLENRELSRKTARNALLPSLDLYGVYSGSGAAGQQNPNYYDKSVTTTLPGGYGGALESTLNNTAPEYRVGVQLSIPLRNRIAKADQYRTELEYRQAQVYFEEEKKRILIEVRSARYNVEQGASRVTAARKAHDLAARTLDIMQKEQKLGAGSNQQTLTAEHDLTVAESALVTAETGYEKARIDLLRATGTVLEQYGISIDSARTGTPPNNSNTNAVPSGQ
jgi:outer membrane protein TolC